MAIRQRWLARLWGLICGDLLEKVNAAIVSINAFALKSQITRDFVNALPIRFPGRQIQSHNQRHDAIDPLATLLLRRLPVVGRILLDRDVARHPAQHRMPAMPKPCREHDLLELLGRRIHAGVALPEGDHLEAVASQLCGQLRRIPAIDGDLRDAGTACPSSLISSADPVVIDHLARRGLDVILRESTARTAHDPAARAVERLPRAPRRTAAPNSRLIGKDQHQRRESVVEERSRPA